MNLLEKIFYSPSDLQTHQDLRCSFCLSGQHRVHFFSARNTLDHLQFLPRSIDFFSIQTLVFSPPFSKVGGDKESRCLEENSGILLNNIGQFSFLVQFLDCSGRRCIFMSSAGYFIKYADQFKQFIHYFHFHFDSKSVSPNLIMTNNYI